MYAYMYIIHVDFFSKLILVERKHLKGTQIRHYFKYILSGSLFSINTNTITRKPHTRFFYLEFYVILKKKFKSYAKKNINKGFSIEK